MTRLTNLPTEILLEIIEYLEFLSDFNAVPRDGNIGIDASSVLHWAAENGKHACLRTLLQAGIPPNPPTRQGSQEPQSAFITAAAFDFEIFDLFVKAGLEPDFASSGGLYETALRKAFIYGNLRAVKSLFEQGVKLKTQLDIDWQNLSIWEDLDIFTEIYNSSGQFPELARFLLQQCNVEDVIESQYLRPFLCLLRAAAKDGDQDLMERLLKIDWTTKQPTITKKLGTNHFDGCPFLGSPHRASREFGDEPREDGDEAPILGAARSGHIEIVRRLLDMGAKLSAENVRGLFCKAVRRPIYSEEPVLEGHLEIAQLLLDRELIGKQDCPHYDDFVMDVVGAGTKVFSVINQYQSLKLHPGNLNHQKALSDTVYSENPAIAKHFLAAGFDPNSCQSSYFETPLCLLTVAGTKSTREYEPTLDVLLDYGADLEWRDPSTGMTPLLVLIEKGENPGKPRWRSVKVLLKKGADPFCVCSRGNTPLLMAAYHDSLATVKVLLEFFDEKERRLNR
ncbi:ankyrin [Penicillium cinerascens]|uniref:Ankyrin n=1 Tax=Penicillium cinerascens TaxID=70096 RepID=A0A9W9J772_9EURO|nr:ankyrin [Penicillium cinerascens]KAJ5190872.1 ankyrin [Penicillium cinerascens]